MAKKNGKKAVSKYVTAYREMIDVMELLENNEPIEVKDDADEDEVKAEIVKAIAMIDKDEFSEDTSEIIEELTPPVKGKNGKKEVEEPAEEEVVSPEDQLKEAIEQAEDIDELRDLVANNKEFKSLRAVIKTFKKMSLLKTAMVELLTDTPAEEVKAEKPAGPKAGVKPNFEKPAYPRINSVCDALLKKPKTIAAWVDEANKLIEAKGGKGNPAEAKTLIKFVSVAVATFAPDVKVPKE